MKRGRRTRNSDLATLALTACLVLHAWGVIVALRDLDWQGGLQLGAVSGGVTASYMAAAFLFNWLAARGTVQSYQTTAALMSALHLIGALALAVLTALPGETLHAAAVAAALVNLPMGSAAVLGGPSPAGAWWAAVFFAANLAGFYLIRWQAEHGNRGGAPLML